jgi:hypothetical protein
MLRAGYMYCGDGQFITNTNLCVTVDSEQTLIYSLHKTISLLQVSLAVQACSNTPQKRLTTWPCQSPYLSARPPVSSYLLAYLKSEEIAINLTLKDK